MRQAVTRLILLGSAALLLMSACGGGGSDGGSNGGGNPQPANVAPTAHAGDALTVAASATVTLSGISSSDTDGTVVGFAWTQTEGIAVTLLNANTSQPSFVAPTVTSNTALTFRLIVTDDDGAVSAPATVRISVTAPLPSIVAVTGTVRYTRPQFLNVSPFGLDYANVDSRPVRGAIVRAIDANTQAVLGTSSTDATGGYRFDIAANTLIAIQVVARLQRETTLPRPHWDVRVQDGVPGTAPYTYTSATLNSSQGVWNFEIPLGISSSGVGTGARASGPFAVLDTIYSALQTITTTVAPTASFPPLIVDWGSQTAGTFFVAAGSQHIALMSDLTEDTDEFDQHVVAHEFGHYIEHNFSRSDSIGGPHAVGDQLDPRVAFGEGFASAFAAIVLGDPLFRDTFVRNGVHVGGGFSVETNPPALQGGGPGCWCSETSVWAIIWDLYDNTFDGVDSVALGFQPIWEVLTTAQSNTPAVTSIFSFIAALNAARPADAILINSLVSSQNTNAGQNAGNAIDAFATTENYSPTGGAIQPLPVFTSVTAGTPVVVRTSGTADRHYNKLGNRRFLRFTPAASGSFTVTLRTSNAGPNPDPDFIVYRSGTEVSRGDDPPTEYPETETFFATAGTTYIIDAYDCANGCSDVQGTPGDYDLTVTIN